MNDMGILAKDEDSELTKRKRIAKQIAAGSYERAKAWGFTEEEAQQWAGSTEEAFGAPPIDWYSLPRS